MATKRTPKVRVKVAGQCEMFATFEMQCPLCGLKIPPCTPHACQKLEPR